MSESPVGWTAAPREERKVVTALFADLVGSTALGERLDAEDVRLVVGEAVARVVAEVERFGGIVKDLAGDGVLAFFGAPVASEDDPERAVRAGLAIVRELDAYAGEVAGAWGIDGFGVRVAAATGPVVLGTIGAGSRVEYAAYGDTVNTAARLQAASEPGTMLVDTTTHRLAAGLFEWAGPRALQLKGKAAPVEAWQAVGARISGRPSRGLEQERAPVLGREQGLGTIRASADQLRGGSGGVLLVTGEAGIGKTRMLAELRTALEDDSSPAPLWLEGRCVSYGESLPLWPFRDLLRGWLDVGVDEPALRVRVALRRAVEQLFGDRWLDVYAFLAAALELPAEAEVAARLDELSPEALQYRTFEVVGELLERLARDAPVVVALEDLHWADPSSVQLVERLLPVTERSALLLAIAQRTERDHPSWQLREHAAREFPHLLHELVLEPLSGDAQRELLHALVGADVLPAAFEDKLLEVGEGNPFFLEELVSSLADAGALARENGSWRFDHAAPVEIPQTVERVILARIDRLAPDCHSVLTAASTLGRRFGLSLLEGVLTEVAADGALADALHELQRLDFVRVERRWPQLEYRFRHVLIQEAAYRTLLSDRRAALHRRAAEWLEREYAGNPDEALGLLAHHWLAAGDEEKAVAYLGRAGDRARLAYALDEAIEHYEMLLPLLERRGERRQTALVLFKLALALHVALRFREANETYQRAFPLWDEPRADEATETLRIALGALPSRPDPLHAYEPVDIQLQMALYDRLVERWPDATIVPSLAERWEIADDGLRYLFQLREGLQWSDGRPITAHDVEFGVKRILDPAAEALPVVIYFVIENAQDYALGRTTDLDAVGVRALGDRRVEFRLAAPAPYFLSVVNRPDCGPQPRHAIERHGETWVEPERHVASGAFRQLERTAERVVLERRSRARRTGNVGRVELRGAATQGELVRLYREDEVDLADAPSSAVEELLESSSPGEVHLSPPGWLVYLLLDHRHPALANREFRLALAHAIDRDEVALALPSPLTIATGGAVPPMLQGHTPSTAPRFEPERARELLARSGVALSELTVVSSPLPWHRQALEFIAGTWSRVLELRVRVERVSPERWQAADTWEDVLRIGPVAFAGWYPGYTDPEYYLRFLLHSESKDNGGHFSHRPYDELLELARREADARTRLELFHRADRMAVAEQAALIPLAYGRNVALVKPWVSGWWEYGKSWPSFADLVVGERPTGEG